MDSKIILGKILQRFSDQSCSQVSGYNSFGYLHETDNAVYVSREKGDDSSIPFKKLQLAIEGYQKNPELYNSGPKELRKLGLTHITSPIYSLLHLLPKESYV